MQHETDVAKLEALMKAAGGLPKEWHVGVSADAAARLEHHGLREGPAAAWVACADEPAARAVEARFLEMGAQPDARGSESEGVPRTQAYLFHAPHLTSFRDWLTTQESKSDEHERWQRKREWTDAVERFLSRCRGWLLQIDQRGMLELSQATQGKAETGLGRYEVPVMLVGYLDRQLQIHPRARNTVRKLAIEPGKELQTVGRVDVTNGMERHLVYRVQADDRELWFVTPERGAPVELTQDSFLGLMEDLLS